MKEITIKLNKRTLAKIEECIIFSEKIYTNTAMNAERVIIDAIDVYHEVLKKQTS